MKQQQDFITTNQHGHSVIKGMSRHFDKQTSIAAGNAVARQLSVLQQSVLAAFAELGSMTGGEAEALARFSDCKPSTIRKRITELQSVQYGCKLVDSGMRRNGMTVYRKAE